MSGSWDSNWEPLEEQPEFLNTQPSFQLEHLGFGWCLLKDKGQSPLIMVLGECILYVVFEHCQMVCLPL